MKHIFKTISSILIVLHLFTVTTFAADTVTFYHTDPAGTPIAMTDNTGKVVWKADYKPFGEEQAVAGTIENNKRFVGKEKDVETGLNYFGARYLKDQTGRFTSVDPVGPVDPMTGQINQTILLNPQLLNRYVYALNNPYKYVDPDGQFFQLIAAEKAVEFLGWAIGGLIIGKVGEQVYKNSKDGMHNEDTNSDSKESASSSESGRKAGKLQPDPSAEGPHSVAKRDPKTGKVEKYETYKPQSNPNNPNKWESEKRYDSKGRAHDNVPTPHVHDKNSPGGVRPPRTDEIPNK